MATIQYSDLDIKERVGAGGFAAVCKGIWKSENMTVAIKTFPAVIPTTEVWFHMYLHVLFVCVHDIAFSYEGIHFMLRWK